MNQTHLQKSFLSIFDGCFVWTLVFIICMHHWTLSVPRVVGLVLRYVFWLTFNRSFISKIWKWPWTSFLSERKSSACTGVQEPVSYTDRLFTLFSLLCGKFKCQLCDHQEIISVLTGTLKENTVALWCSNFWFMDFTRRLVLKQSLGSFGGFVQALVWQAVNGGGQILCMCRIPACDLLTTGSLTGVNLRAHKFNKKTSSSSLLIVIPKSACMSVHVAGWRSGYTGNC